jgi:hypothetical protein
MKSIFQGYLSYLPCLCRPEIIRHCRIVLEYIDVHVFVGVQQHSFCMYASEMNKGLGSLDRNEGECAKYAFRMTP